MSSVNLTMIERLLHVLRDLIVIIINFLTAIYSCTCNVSRKVKRSRIILPPTTKSGRKLPPRRL